MFLGEILTKVQLFLLFIKFSYFAENLDIVVALSPSIIISLTTFCLVFYLLLMLPIRFIVLCKNKQNKGEGTRCSPSAFDATRNPDLGVQYNFDGYYCDQLWICY